MKTVKQPKPTAADKQLAEKIIKHVSVWCGFYRADVEGLEALLAVERSKIKKATIATMAKTLGRRGGLKGGPARAAKLTSSERSEIATKASKARWGN